MRKLLLRGIKPFTHRICESHFTSAQRTPRVRSHAAVDCQTAVSLKVPNGSSGDGSEAAINSDVVMSVLSEPTLQVYDRIASATFAKHWVGRMWEKEAGITKNCWSGGCQRNCCGGLRLGNVFHDSSYVRGSFYSIVLQKQSCSKRNGDASSVSWHLQVQHFGYAIPPKV